MFSIALNPSLLPATPKAIASESTMLVCGFPIWNREGIIYC